MKYVRADSIEQAVALLRDDGVALAGGTVLVPIIKHAFDSQQTLVDLSQLAELHQVRAESDHLHLGAAVSIAEIETAPAVRQHYTALSQAAAAIGNPQIRRVGTIGGNIAIGIPGADLLPALLAFDAGICLRQADAEKLVPLHRILSDGLPANSLITAIQIPASPSRRSAFHKYAWRQAAGKTIVSVAASARFENNRAVDPRLVAGGLSRAQRLSQAEALLQSQAIDEKLLLAVAEKAGEEAICERPARPAEAYRRKLVRAGMLHILSEMFR